MITALFRKKAGRKKLPKSTPRSRFKFVATFETLMLGLSLAVIVGLASYMKLGWQDIENMMFGNLKQVQLVGEYRHINRSSLEDIFEPVLGQHLMSLDLAELESRFAVIPWVQDVTITRVWPDQLSVRIQERQAVARWQERGLIDQDGQVFFPSTVAHPELPSLIIEPDDSASALSFYYHLSEVFRQLNTPITHLIEDSPRSWKIAFNEGFIITLGQHDIEQRAQRFVVAYDRDLRSVKEHIQCVDLRYPDGFSIRWKKKGEQSLC